MIYPWQNTQWQSFKKLISSQRLPHAILLTGIAGLGKSDFASQMAATILCLDRRDDESCGQCHSCQLFEAGNHPDHILISPEETAKQIKIEQIRALKEKQALTPTVSDWKTMILSPAESMNISSSNSLLKLLEEPQTNTIIILVASKTEGLPVTILSRCQKMLFIPPETQQVIAWLKQQGNNADSSEIEKIIPLAKGAPLKSLELLEADIIEQTRQLETDFKQMISGHANPVLLAQKWQQWDLELSFNYLQSLVQKMILNHFDKGYQGKARRYWHIHDCIINTIKLLSSSNNINKILLIEQFIVSVMDVNWDSNNSISNRG